MGVEHQPQQGRTRAVDADDEGAAGRRRSYRRRCALFNAASGWRTVCGVIFTSAPSGRLVVEVARLGAGPVAGDVAELVEQLAGDRLELAALLAVHAPRASG